MDDSGVPLYLRLWYEDIIRNPDPLQVSADQLKFGEGYTIKFWELRHLLIETYKCDLDKELAFLEELLAYDTRNELKWEHRRWIVQKFEHDAPRKDLESIKKTIHHEADNPLAWSHRQWVFQTFGGDWEGEWEDELTYCDKVIREDIFNSFAWDQDIDMIRARLQELESKVAAEPIVIVTEKHALVIVSATDVEVTSIAEIHLSKNK